MKIKKNALIRSYAQSMGIEAAKDLITKKIKSAGLEEKEHYTEEETAKICGELIKEGGLIRIVAQNFVVQLERKRSEEQALLLDNIETQIWYLRDIETYGAVNKAHAEFLGMEKGNLEGESLYDIVGREEVRVCVAGNREVFEKKKQTRTEEWVKNGRGKTRLLSITRTPKIDDNGNVEYVICAAEDITDRKQAEKRIEHLNSVLKAIRSVNQMVVVEKDRDSLLQKACNALVEARGYDAAWLGFLSNGETFATVKGSGFREDIARFSEHVMGGDYPPCIRNALAQQEKLVVVDKSRECGDCFFKSACAGNEAAIIRVEYTGRLFGLLATLFAPDVTADEEEKGLLREVAGDLGFAFYNMELEEDRKRAEEMLRESEETFKAISVAANDGIIMIDNEGKVAYWNKAAEKIFGYTDEEILGKELRSILVPKRFHEAFETGFSKFKMTGQGAFVWKTLELAAVKKDGVEFPTELSMSAVKIGGKWNAIGLVRDITKRKQAEEKIKEYSENLENMVEERTRELRCALYDTEESRDKIDGILKSVGDGLIVTDIYNRIILMNRAAEDLLGVRFSEVIDRPIDVAIKDETLRLRFKTSLEEREPGYQFDFELPGENSKHPRIIRARTSEIKDKTGKQTGIISIIYDVTLEREVDRMKTEFLSTASHQLRTPLTSILGFSEILMTRDNIKEKQQKEFISYINKQSVNLANIINDLLDISRIESGIGFTLHKVSCNINEIIREMVKHFQVSEPERQFDIILPKEPLELMVDKDKIGQVLENLLDNAVKYSPGGEAICLTAKKIAEAEIEISVADQGIGMSPEQVEKIFDKFYRADASDSAISGTGLGMSIVKNYVEAHVGKVWVESELGKGTTVTFVIPT